MAHDDDLPTGPDDDLGIRPGSSPDPARQRALYDRVQGITRVGRTDDAPAPEPAPTPVAAPPPARGARHRREHGGAQHRRGSHSTR